MSAHSEEFGLVPAAVPPEPPKPAKNYLTESSGFWSWMRTRSRVAPSRALGGTRTLSPWGLNVVTGPTSSEGANNPSWFQSPHTATCAQGPLPENCQGKDSARSF